MQKIIYKLINCCHSRFGFSLLGLASIMGLCLMLGWHLRWRTITYIVVVVAIFAAFVLMWLLHWLWLRHKGKRLQKSLHAQNNSIAGHKLEAELLKEKMVAALAQISSSELGRRYFGSTALYVLPWFVVIGPSAAGKSTLLRNSGLHFPQTTDKELQLTGYGGTRSCDWWFSDKAIILDTAGRYTTETNDHGEWLEFLHLLKKYRPRLPLNGVIVTLSMPDILMANEVGLATHAKIIRARIHELYQNLALLFPVTIVITKCDLLAGFTEYFSELTEQERQQPFGIDLTKDCDDQLQQLCAQLRKLRLNKISLEHNLFRKQAIFNFPLQFDYAFERIKQFVTLLLRDNPYQETPLYSGLYFTSGTQEGWPLERLLSSLSVEFTQSKQDGEKLTEHKSYFISKLFTKVIIANKDNVAASKRRIRGQRLWRSFIVLFVASIIAGFFLLYSVAYRGNMSLLHHGEQVAVVSVQQTSFANLQHSFAYYTLLQNYAHKTPLFFRMGLYRGDQLLPLWRHILIMRMNRLFYRRMGNYIETGLIHYIHSWQLANATEQQALRGRYYACLRSYLMLVYPQRMSFTLEPSIFAYYWLHFSGMRVESGANYTALIKFYLHHMQPWPLNRRLVEQARKQLLSADHIDNVYAFLQYALSLRLKPISLAQLLTANGSGLIASNYQLPGIYTKQAWLQMVQLLLSQLGTTVCNGDWVLRMSFDDLALNVVDGIKCSHDHVVAIQNMLKRRYFHDYKRAWFKLFASINMPRLNSLTVLNEKLPQLVSHKGPIAELFNSFATNVDLPELKPLATAANKLINDGLPKYLQQLLRIQSDLQRLITLSATAEGAERYAAALIGGSGGKSELYRSMIATNLLLDDVVDSDFKQTLLVFFLQPLQQVWQTILLSTASDLQQEWRDKILDYLQQNFVGHFPFDRYATNDISVTDFDRFFNPATGVLWDFLHKRLAPFLSFTESGWRVHRWLNIGLPFKHKSLLTLLHLHKIIASMYRDDNKLGFSYWLYPIPTKGLAQIMVVANGQDYSYRNGPQEWFGLQWPGSDLQQASYFMIATTDGAQLQSRREIGVWGLLHLFAAAKIERRSESIIHLSLPMQSNSKHYLLRFMLRADGEINPFYELLTGKLTLPTHIFH